MPAGTPAVVVSSLVGEQDRARIDQRRANAKAPNTVGGYASAWRRYSDWCARRGAPPLPTHPEQMPLYQEALAAYLAEADDTIAADGTPAYARSTLESWSAAIGYHFGQAGLPNPARSAIVAETMTGIRKRRTAAGIGAKKADPLLADMLTRIVTSIDVGAVGWKATVAARRDIALLVVQYAAGLRRTELANLWVGDVSRAGDPRDEYLLVRIRGSKKSPTDMEYVAVRRGEHARTCPWCALLRWTSVLAAFDRALAAATRDPSGAGQLAIERTLRRDDTATDLHICDREWPRSPRLEVPLFRPLDRDGLPHPIAITDRSVPNILKSRATQAGYEPAVVQGLRGHSARAGTATQALAAGVDIYTVAKHLRHRDTRSTAAYDRRAPWAGHTAADHLGL
ncbi:hypothetical protein AB0L82_35535 [Nocardia sp. NPDC052001]|uniref:hypothetical protein n=1 Tax=Nocardia sp. NPDC052001 TaxID=3154853 RepID=UPI003416EBC7